MIGKDEPSIRQPSLEKQGAYRDGGTALGSASKIERVHGACFDGTTSQF